MDIIEGMKERWMGELEKTKQWREEREGGENSYSERVRGKQRGGGQREQCQEKERGERLKEGWQEGFSTD